MANYAIGTCVINHGEVPFLHFFLAKLWAKIKAQKQIYFGQKYCLHSV